MYSIGDLSRRTGVNIETVRYYERIGLIPAPARSEGGHRLYGGGHLLRLNFVRRARDLGFTLNEVRALLDLAEDLEDMGETALAQIALTQMKHTHAAFAMRRSEAARLAQRVQGVLFGFMGGKVAHVSLPLLLFFIVLVCRPPRGGPYSLRLISAPGSTVRRV